MTVLLYSMDMKPNTKNQPHILINFEALLTMDISLHMNNQLHVSICSRNNGLSRILLSD